MQHSYSRSIPGLYRFLRKQGLTKHYSFQDGSDKPTIFQLQLREHEIRHKLIRPYTPRHNGKVERSHRKGIT